MSKITLARALKYKNRVAQRLQKLRDDVQRFNSVIAENDREIDVVATLEEIVKLENHLVELKLKLDQATTPIKPVET